MKYELWLYYEMSFSLSINVIGRNVNISIENRCDRDSDQILVIVIAIAIKFPASRKTDCDRIAIVLDRDQTPGAKANASFIRTFYEFLTYSFITQLVKSRF